MSGKNGAKSEEKRKPGRPRTGQMPLRHMRIGDDDWAAINAAAAAAGAPTTAWCRRVLTAAAKRVLRR